MKIMCPRCYHHSGFVTTHALGHMMYGSHDVRFQGCIYIYIYIYIYTYIYIYIYIYLPVNAIVKLPYPWSGGSQQEMFLGPPADNQTRNYDTECSNHHPSLSTLRSKGLTRSKIKW